MKRIAATIVTFLCCLCITGQPVCHVTRYDETADMAQWHVTQILQDRMGMIWMSTWSGLIRFDGQEFRCFKSQPGDGCPVPTDRIRDIWLLGNGNIGCMVDEETFEFDLRTCRFSKLDKTMRKPGMGVFIGDGRQFSHTDKHGTTWIVHSDGTLSYTAGDGDGMHDYFMERPLGNIRLCMADRQGNLWLISSFCVYKLSFARRPFERLPQRQPAQVRGLMIDAKHRYWVATKEDATVRLYDGGNTLLGYLGRDGRLHTQYCSFGSPVYCLEQMDDGTIFMGSKPGGLFRLKEAVGGAFLVDRIGGLNCDNVYDIKADRHGHLWVATLGGGVNCITNPLNAVPTVINPDNGMGDYPHGACRKVRYLHITANDVLLAATTEGLLVAKLGGKGGIRALAFKRHVREADRATSLSGSATMDIAEDSRHRIFISTESGGVNMIASANLLGDSLDFVHFNVRNGFPTDIAFSTTAIGDRLLVVGSDRLLRLNPGNGAHESFDARFFLSDIHFSDAHPIVLPDGRWLFGLQDGALAIRPSALRKSTLAPSIALTAVSIQGGQDLAVNRLDTLTLLPDERSVTIHFAALDYTAATAIEYAFRLVADGGRGEKWNDIGRNRSVTLLDLTPGTYTLQLRSTNGDGVWADNMATLTIIVRPMWHETIWARTLFAVALLAALLAVVCTLLYIKRIKRQQREALEAYLALLSKANLDDAPPKPRAKVDAEDDAMMKRVTAFVEQHIGDADINIGDLAAAAATSRSGLQRRMRQLLGITPLDFLREARIKRASQLLTDTGATVSEVAFSCGFADPKYFSRCFKSSVGLSPTDYKNAHSIEGKA